MKTIYYGGSILTMENQNDCPEAICVEDGYIKKIGRYDEVLVYAGTDANLVNLEGKCLMPSFIDPHSHIAMNGQMALFADLSTCNNFSDIESTMRAYVEANQITPDQVAVGFGYDHNFLDEQTHPDKFVLDRVSETVPILILHTSGHLGCCNSVMLELARVDSTTQDPQGGKYGRMENSSEPNGYLEETAMMGTQAVMGSRVKPDIVKMLSAMQKAYIENGVTTAQEGAGSEQYLGLLRMADMQNILKMDVVVYPVVGNDIEDICAKNADLLCKYNKHLKIGGYKMILDGSPQGRSAWMSQPYLGGEEGYCGYPWLSDEDACKYATLAVKNNMQILTHCNGDAASEQFLNAYEKALEVYNTSDKKELRPVMIHCQTVRNDQLDRMAEINMIPSIFVGHVYYWGDVHMKNFGPERGHHISPVKDALDRGLVINFHQDTPITRPNMLHSVWCAVNRMSREGNVIGENQKVDVYTALKAVTINAAYQYFEEDSKGSIKEGKRADLVILDRNPLNVPAMEIKDIIVLETIKDGVTIFKRL